MVNRSSVASTGESTDAVRAAADAPVSFGYPWRIFWLLLAAALIGAVGLLPFVLDVFAQLAPADRLPEPTPFFVATQILHLGLIFGIATGLGLLLAPKAGIHLPLIDRWLRNDRTTAIPKGSFRVALVAGLFIGGATATLLHVVYLPQLARWPSEAVLPIWKRFLVCIYGGINEELLMRLFFLSVVIWLLQKIARRTARSTRVLFWIANLVVALLFGASYLPATAAMVPLTPFLVIGIISIKGVAGLIFGKLCWDRGLEVAMLAHFVSDLLIHVVAPMITGR